MQALELLVTLQSRSVARNGTFKTPSKRTLLSRDLPIYSLIKENVYESFKGHLVPLMLPRFNCSQVFWRWNNSVPRQRLAWPLINDASRRREISLLLLGHLTHSRQNATKSLIHWRDRHVMPIPNFCPQKEWFLLIYMDVILSLILKTKFYILWSSISPMYIVYETSNVVTSPSQLLRLCAI